MSSNAPLRAPEADASHPPAFTCPNCQTTGQDEYCPHCGQKRFHDGDLSLRHAWHHVLHETLHLDGRVFTTLKLLFTRPGQLTLDFVDWNPTTVDARLDVIGVFHHLLSFRFATGLAHGLDCSDQRQTHRALYVLGLLDELPGVLEHRLLWSARRRALVRFSRRDHPGDPRQPLRLVIDTYLTFIQEEPELYRFVVRRSFPDRPVQRDPVTTNNELIAGTLSKVFAERLRKLGMDPGGAETWAHAGVGMVQAAGDWWLERRTLSREALRDYLLMMAWGALDGILQAGGSPDRMLAEPGTAPPVPDEPGPDEPVPGCGAGRRLHRRSGGRLLVPPIPARTPLPAAHHRAWTVLRHDVAASPVVFLVAVPLSLGIAVASGAPVMAGLIAAVVGGVVAGLLGGSPLQVSGPAAGLTVVVADLVARFGWAVTCAITVAAGLLQMLFGLSRVARAVLAISPLVVHAMLAGIGITIALGQLHVLLGGAAVSIAGNAIAVPLVRGSQVVLGLRKGAAPGVGGFAGVGSEEVALALEVVVSPSQSRRIHAARASASSARAAATGSLAPVSARPTTR